MRLSAASWNRGDTLLFIITSHIFWMLHASSAHTGSLLWTSNTSAAAFEAVIGPPGFSSALPPPQMLTMFASVVRLAGEAFGPAIISDHSPKAILIMSRQVLEPPTSCLERDWATISLYCTPENIHMVLWSRGWAIHTHHSQARPNHENQRCLLGRVKHSPSEAFWCV